MMKTTLVTTLSLVGVLGAGTAAALVNTSIFDSTPQNDAAAFVPGADLVQLTLPEPSATVIDPAQNAAGNATVVAAATANPSQIADTSNDMPAQSASTATAATSRIAGSAIVNVTATTLPTDDTPNTTLPVDDTPDTTTPDTPDTTLPIDDTPDTTTPDTPDTTTPAPQNPSLLTTYDLGGAGSVTVDVVNGRMTLIDATAAAGWVVTDAEVDAVANQVEVTLSDGSMIVDFEVGYVAGALVPEIRTEAVSSGYHDDDHDEDDDDDHDEDDHDDDEDDHDEDDEDHEDDD
jgi:hypothetical protein